MLDKTALLNIFTKAEISTRDFQIKNIPKFLVVQASGPANNIRTGPDAHPTRLDNEALLQAVHLFYGVLQIISSKNLEIRKREQIYEDITGY